MSFDWKWCRIHDAPLIARGDGWACYWKHYLPPSPLDVTTVRIEHKSSPLSESGKSGEEADQ